MSERLLIGGLEIDTEEHEGKNGVRGPETLAEEWSTSCRK